MSVFVRTFPSTCPQCDHVDIAKQSVHNACLLQSTSMLNTSPY